MSALFLADFFHALSTALFMAAGVGLVVAFLVILAGFVGMLSHLR